MKGNAKIRSTFLGYEDHGCLTCFIILDDENSSQAFGGYRIDAPNNEPSSATNLWVKKILEIADVSSWEEIKGQHVRVDGEQYGEIRGIGHITKDKWFYPKEEISKLNKQELALKEEQFKLGQESRLK